jgi:hypothetical protein
MSKNAKNIFYKTLAMSNDINFRGKGARQYFSGTKIAPSPFWL